MVAGIPMPGGHVRYSSGIRKANQLAEHRLRQKARQRALIIIARRYWHQYQELYEAEVAKLRAEARAGGDSD